MVNTSKSKKSEFKESKEESIMYAEYNFPHGVINLEQIRTEVNPEVSKFFDKIEINPKNVDKFLRTFGDIVPTQVTLGGKLYVTMSISDYLAQNSTDDKTDVKVKAQARTALFFGPLDVGGGYH